MSYYVVEQVLDGWDVLSVRNMGRFSDFESALKYLESVIRSYHGADETKGWFYNIQWAEDEDNGDSEPVLCPLSEVD